MKIKICGIKRIEDIDYINEYCPDYMGFVFAKSSRHVTFDEAKILSSKIEKNTICSGFNKAVGVFVNEEIAYIKKIFDCGIIEIAQLHGDESIEYIEKLKQKIPEIEIIKALKLSADSATSKEFEKYFFDKNIDHLLLDSEVAGSGVKTYDWAIAESIHKKTDKKIFLAGGLDQNNINEAKSLRGVFCLDISSGTETNGVKDKEKICNVIKSARE